MTKSTEKIFTYVLVGVCAICLLLAILGFRQVESIEAEMRPPRIEFEKLTAESLHDLQKVSRNPDMITSPGGADFQLIMAAQKKRSAQINALTPKLNTLHERRRKYQTLRWASTGIGVAALCALILFRFIQNRKESSEGILPFRDEQIDNRENPL